MEPGPEADEEGFVPTKCKQTADNVNKKVNKQLTTAYLEEEKPWQSHHYLIGRKHFD